ncbi:MAG: BatD family protein [Bacteroidales bacterium]|jgi:hypothetical protein|nr:BatD family protein [Bacteroidales bacterium]
MKSGFIKALLYITGVIFALAPLNTISADEVEFSAQAKTTVSQGETFRVIFSLNAQGDNFQAPGFKGFSVVSGPNPSTSSSFQMINGKVTQSVQQSFTYLIHATSPGSFDIGSASIVVDGKTYRSNALKITVVTGDAGNRRQTQAAGSPSDTQSPDNDDATGNKNDAFIRTFVSKTNPVQGEQITATTKVYTRVGISSLELKTNLSTVQGFWSADLLRNANVPTDNEIINGERYVTKEIQKVALFPLKSGELSIPAIEMEAIVQVQKTRKRSSSGDPFFDSFFNDAFFNTSVEQVKRKLSSPAVRLNVQALPEAGKPSDFSGAVGSFNFEAKVDRTELKANEAINLKITISGIGNIDLIDKFNITFPSDFETYDPKINTHTQITSGKLGGSKTFEYLLIPRNAGEFTIKPIEFSYYDPNQKKYFSRSSSEFKFKVAKGDGNTSAVSYSGVNQQDIQYIGSDIRHIKVPPFALSESGNILIGSMLYWLIFGGLFFLASILYFWMLHRRKLAGNTGQMKLRRANKVSRKRLRKAAAYLKTAEEAAFYNEISAALWGYLSDKFNIPLARLSMDSVNDALSERSVSAETIAQFRETLDNCEFARFAPGDKTANMEGIYQQALAIISRIERELR